VDPWRNAARIILVFTAGFAVGTGLPGPSMLLDPTLYLMMAAVGAVIALDEDPLGKLRRAGPAGVALAVVVLVASTLAGLLVAGPLGLDPRLSAAVGAGCGWYSFTGPYLAGVDPYMGFVGFTSNLLRELATMILYPVLAQRFPLQAVALGGATTMDSTLPVIARYGGSHAAMLGLVQGFIITLAVPIVVPFVVGV